MADSVRYFLERMVPELEDLEEKGYFSKQELREIVRKRENFEYALKRRPPLKADFLRYIEHEEGLAELIQLRKAAYGIEAKKGIGDVGLISRCHFLYERATKKFKGDLRLWLSWLEYCKKTNSTRQISKVLTKALQINPTAAGLWSYAAAWEFDSNRDAAAARKLMQQGLRLCGTDEGLWLDYLRMELVYARKLRLRRKILGIESQVERERELEAEGVPEPAEKEEAALDAVLSGGIAKLVAREAVAKNPGSLAFRQRLLDVLQDFSFPGAAQVAQDIVAGVQADFPASEEAWDLRARQRRGALAAAAGGGDSAEAALLIYEAAAEQLPTTKMFDLYSAFLASQIWPDQEEDEGRPLRGHRKKLAKQLLEVFRRAAQAGCLSIQGALEWPQLALQCSRVREALEAARVGTERHPSAGAVWSQRVTLLAQQAAVQEGGEREASHAGLLQVLQHAAHSVERESVAKVWLLGLQTLKQLGMPIRGLLPQMELFLAGGVKLHLDAEMGEAAGEAVCMTKEEQGIEAARRFYGALLKLPSCGGRLFHTVLDMELAESKQRLPHKKLKAIFEAAVDAYGQDDVRLWLRYAKFEAAEGRGSGSVYWKATKTLAAPESFITQMP